MCVWQKAPCPWCTTTKEDTFNQQVEKPFLTCADMMAAKATTKVTVILTRSLVNEIQATLAPDFDKDGQTGRALTAPVGILRVGDRLEPVKDVPDPMVNVRKLAKGTKLRFYRRHPNARLTFWSPLLFGDDSDDECPLAPQQICGDMLHTMDGGVCADNGAAIFALFFKNPIVLHVQVRGKESAVQKRVARCIGPYLDQFHATQDAVNLRSRLESADITFKTLLGQQVLHRPT